MMETSSEVYQFLERELRGSLAASDSFTELVAASLKIVPDSEFELRRRRHASFVAFFEAAKGIFRETLKGAYSEQLRRWLLRDSESFLPGDLYKRLPEEAWTIPRFFRTDESKSGLVFELQCPGSGWGDLPLLAKLYRTMGGAKQLDGFAPEVAVANDIAEACGEAVPQVLHLLDNASNPVSMRYFMSVTQPPLHYCGYSKAALNGKANFIRSHSVFGLVSENLFRARLARCARGELVFDLPPLVIFDQKMMLCLPFLVETRDLFDDAIRNILTYSYPVSAAGFRDVDGSWVTIEEFLGRTPARRRYFLKYAGSDTNRNWGSRAVRRLNRNTAAEILRAAVAEAENGYPWIIQPEISEKELVDFFDRDSNTLMRERKTAKYSAFYGPSGLVGLRTMHRLHQNVHGQEDTVVGLAVPGVSSPQQFV